MSKKSTYYQQDSIVFMDGNWIRASEANVSAFNQTMHYGYGVFDGLRSYKNADGCNIYMAKQHFERFVNSGQQLKITIDYTADELVSIAYKLLEKNGLETSYIRPMIYMSPNMELNVSSQSHVFIGAWPWKKYLGSKPIDVMVSEFRKNSTESYLINAKIAGNYTHAILASYQARKLGYDEALMLDMNGYIAEGPASNFFYEKDGVLYTPTTNAAFPGITRKTLMSLAKAFGIEVVEKDITVEEVYSADCAFFTGTATEVAPIKSINGEELKGVWEESNGHSLSLMYLRQVKNNELLGLTIV